MPASPTPPRLAASAGFTLLELLVVIGVISVLLGIGLGYLGRTDPEMVARSVLAGELRKAQMTARAEGVPTEVLVVPGADGEAASVRSRVLEPVAAFHFEPDTPVLDERMRPELAGEDVAAGRFGHARRAGDEDARPLLRWPLVPLLADLREGFVLRVDLFLERRGTCLVAEMDPLLELRLDDDLYPQARVRLTGVGDDSLRVRVAGRRALPLLRWTTLEVGCDGREVWLAIDGREVGRAAGAGAPKQPDDMVLDLSPPDAAVPGLVDELRLLAFAYTPAQLLPIELQPRRPFRFTFDARGEPVLAPEIVYEDLEDS
ncbi:MAG TPA: prepilin-type N-terminal cleavage/methylation domain-containing protein [bacterium]|nr:prepilin-type N-terminal cleavage/methylation domain-containing protein [bacterium]